VPQPDDGGPVVGASPAPTTDRRHTTVSEAVAALTMTVGRGAHARLVCDLTGVGPGDRAVDVGCGPGTAVREAARRGAAATGVDPVPLARGLARGMTRRVAAPGSATFVDGVAERLPLATAGQTVAWALASAHHWDDVEAALDELHRVLAPGGRFAVVERRVGEGAHGHAAHGFTEHGAEAFAELARARGFVDVERTEVVVHRPLVVVSGRREVEAHR